jgi:uncharacterized beta-barrel protein YwiB (DUF1934 family)
MKSAKITFQMAIDGRIDTQFTVNGKAGEGHLEFSDGGTYVYDVAFDQIAIRFHRTGAVDMDFPFTCGVHTAGTITVDGVTARLLAKTRRLDVRDHRIELEYDLLQGGASVSRHQLTIEWQITEEREET